MYFDILISLFCKNTGNSIQYFKFEFKSFTMTKSLSPDAARLKELIDFDKRLFFFLIVILFLVIRFLTNTLILEAIPGHQNLEESGEFLVFHIFNTLNYIWTPFALLWKFTVIAFLFWLGSFMIGYKVPFKELWQFALVAEVIFIFPELIRLLVYLSPDPSVSFREIDEYRPFSLLSVFDTENLASRYHYAFASLNVFEILYGIFWVYGFQMISRRSLKESFHVVLLSYFFPLLLWLGFYVLVYRA